ncbi:MAG: HEAT repeat domain-containing protein [Deltaproteobacteria bacterium]|nr:HEAT repeat domain-containing protein [Deltaproteobacteria bacterium]
MRNQTWLGTGALLGFLSLLLAPTLASAQAADPAAPVEATAPTPPPPPPPVEAAAADEEEKESEASEADPTAPVTAEPAPLAAETLEAAAPVAQPELLAPPVQLPPADAQPLAPEARRYLDEIRPFFDGASLAQKQEVLERFAGATDPAVASALGYIAENDNTASISATATRLLGTLDHPEAFTTLGRLARLSERHEVWRAAVDALGERGNQSAGEILFELAADEDLKRAKRRMAIAVLEEHYPELAAQRGTPRVAGSRLVPALGGAFFGGYTLYTVGQFALSDAGPVIGALGGGAIGLTTGFLLGGALTTDRSLLYSSTMGWGVGLGQVFVAASSRFPDKRYQLAMGVVGELIGGGAAYLMGDALDYSAGQLIFINVNGLAGAMLGTGLGWINDSREWRVTPALTLLGSLAGLGISGFAAKHTSLDAADIMLSSWAAAEGGWVGAWIPEFAPDADRWGTFWVGSTLGLFAGEAIAHFVTLEPSDVGQMAMLSVYGKSLGAGLALMGQGSVEAVTATQLAVGALGLGAGALLKGQLHYTAGDATAIPVATGLGLWHGLALGGYLFDRDTIEGDQFAGLALTVPSLFGLGAVAATQYSDPTPWEVAMGSMGAVWGAWFVAWTAALGSWDFDAALLGTLAGSDVGLLVTALLVSPLVGLDPMILAGSSVGGVVLTGLVTLVAAMLTEDPNALIATNLVASGVGLLGGAVITWTLVDGGKGGGDGVSVASTKGQGLELPAFVLSFQPAINSRGEVDGAMVAVTF